MSRFAAPGADIPCVAFDTELTEDIVDYLLSDMENERMNVGNDYNNGVEEASFFEKFAYLMRPVLCSTYVPIAE